MDIDNALTLAVQHHEAGQLPEAESIYRQILQAESDQPDALHLLGVLAHQLRQHERALELIQRATNSNPQNANFHNSLGNVLRALERPEQSVVAYQRAIELDPSLATAHSNLGTALQELGKAEEAVSAYRQAIELKPDYADAHYNLGTALKDRGKLTEAVNEMKRAIELNPQYPHAYVVLAGYLLQLHNAGKALGACDACLGIDPRNLFALAFKSIALAEVGQRDTVRYLVDFDRFIQRRRIDPPAGFPSLAEFNTALAKHIRTHPTMITEPTAGATRFGGHTEELLGELAGAFAGFATTINDAIAEYLRALPADPDHSYLAWKPKRWQLSTWGVILGTQGHQMPHNHPDGWVSGVYYLKLPGVVKTSDRKQPGWIEFGQPPAEFHDQASSEVRAIQPEEGLLVLFPSYFYHRTIPFESTEERICFAVDAIPEV